jgi:hypothetical protein
VRQWQLVAVAAVAACGRAEAETIQASFAVSVTVVDQCIVRPTIRSATCTGGADYAVGVAREKVSVPTRVQLTNIGEHVHTSGDGPLIATSSSAAGLSAAGGQIVGLAGIADRSVAPGFDQVDAVRITYSF